MAVFGLSQDVPGPCDAFVKKDRDPFAQDLDIGRGPADPTSV
jgi:hypothetical protein